MDVDIGATLFDGHTAVPCRLRNMCSKGFLIEAAHGVPVGRSVNLTVPLYPSQWVYCTVEIRHVNAERLGALVTQISAEDQSLCAQFLKEMKLARATQVALT